MKLTSRNPVSIEREIKTRFDDVVSIQLRGVSLKVTCRSEEQREKIRGCTSLGDTSVVASLPFSEERRRREAIPKLHRVAVGGVPVDMAEDGIKNETGAALFKRISKRDQSGVPMPTVTVLVGVQQRRRGTRQGSAAMVENEDPTIHPARHEVLPLSRLRTCSTTLLQADRRLSSLRRFAQVRRLSDEGPEEMRQLQR